MNEETASMKTALVWVAGGDIGRALVAQLVADEWTVYAIAHYPGDQALEALTPHVMDANVSVPYEVQMAITTLSQEVPQLDLWIYAAGDITSAKVAEMGPEAWERILDANLNGAFLTTHYSLPLLADEAHLVFIGAISERLRLPGLGAYAAAKAGLEAFIEALSKEERKRRVTLVRPAAVTTSFWEKVPFRMPANALSPEAVAQRVLEAHYQGHKGILDLSE
jgi:NAD(P)-dependent dehydrogenase (short-subunit alcohol dehydrogenase family)